MVESWCLGSELYKRILYMSDNNKIILSIITVTYNSSNDIENTIANVCRFVSPYIEYIIVDGGSTDGTKDIIQNYNDQITNWISEKDDGIYDAMNKGIRLASGVWCIFINSGDYLLHIPEQLFDDNYCKYSAIAASVKTDRDEIIMATYDWRMKLHNTLPHQGIFYNLSKDVVYYNTYYKIFADYDLNLRMYLEKKPVLILDDVVAFHSLTGISNSNTAREEALAVLKNNCGYYYLLLSWIYRHYLGIKSRIKNV